MNMNDCRKNSVTFLVVSLSVYKYRVRNMHKIVTKSVNMNLIRRAGALGDNKLQTIALKYRLRQWLQYKAIV
jgi:hypothetical protein